MLYKWTGVMFDLTTFLHTIQNIEKNDFKKYLESIYLDFYNYLYSLDYKELKIIRYELEDLLYDLIENELISEMNANIVNALLQLLAEQFEQLHLTGTIIEIIPFLPDSSTKQRLESSILYLKVNNLNIEYHKRFNQIMSLIVLSDEDEEFRYKTDHAVIHYYLHAMKQFIRVKNKALADSFKTLFLTNQDKYAILKRNTIPEVIEKVDYIDGLRSLEEAQSLIEKEKQYQAIYCIEKDISHVTIEKSDYSKKLYTLKNPDFQTIKQVSIDYINSISYKLELYERIDRGRTIIDDEELLFQYMFSYATMHKAKLYESFDLLVKIRKGSSINIIDWGCGQALATSLLIDYLKEKAVLDIDITDITLIDASKLALSRGLLHIDILKQKTHKIKVLHTDLNCIDQSDLLFDNEHPTLHLFSNILDAEFFKLDKSFLENISQSIRHHNYFLCVSPNINAKRNERLDLFYKYFDDNFNTELISSRDTDVGKYRRYEKIFKVKHTNQVEITEIKHKITEESKRLSCRYLQ